MFEGETIQTRTCVSLDFSGGQDGFELVSSSLSFSNPDGQVSIFSSRSNSRTIAYADNSTQWDGWLNVTVNTASYRYTTFVQPQSPVAGNDVVVCGFMRLVDGGRSALAIVELDGSCPTRPEDAQILHLTTDANRRCTDDAESPLDITTKANLTTPAGLFGGHFVSVDETIEGSTNKGCRQLDFGVSMQGSSSGAGQISGSLRYRQRYTLGSGQRVQQNYSMEFETATAVVQPAPSPSPSPSVNGSAAGNGSEPEIEPWAGWTRVTGPISVVTLQAGEEYPSRAESFQGCGFLYYDRDRDEVTAQLNPDPRKTCMESPTEGRQDTNRFVGYREARSVQCLADGSAPGALGPQGPAKGDIPGTFLSQSLRGYYSAAGGGGVDCLGFAVYDTSMRLFRQLAPPSSQPPRPGNATQTAYFISMAQNVTEGPWKDWVKFQAVEHVEYLTSNDEIVDQESDLVCGYIRQPDLGLGTNAVQLALGSDESSGATRPGGCPDFSQSQPKLFTAASESQRCSREPAGAPSPGAVEVEYWGVFGGVTLNFTDEDLPDGSIGCVEIDVDPLEQGRQISVFSRIVTPDRGILPLQENTDQVIGAGVVSSGDYEGWYRVISLVEVPAEYRDEDG